MVTSTDEVLPTMHKWSIILRFLIPNFSTESVQILERFCFPDNRVNSSNNTRQSYISYVFTVQMIENLKTLWINEY